MLMVSSYCDHISEIMCDTIACEGHSIAGISTSSVSDINKPFKPTACTKQEDFITAVFHNS